MAGEWLWSMIDVENGYVGIWYERAGEWLGSIESRDGGVWYGWAGE